MITNVALVTDITIPDSSALSTVLNEIGVDVGTPAEIRYIYLQGCASTLAGSWVTYTSTGTTALLTANAVGNVAIAMSACDATSKYGYYQIVGANTIALSDTTATNKPLYIDATNGKVDDAVVSGDLIMNAFSTSSDTAGVLPVRINRPFVTDALG